MKEEYCTLCTNDEDQYCNMDFTPEEILAIKEQYIKVNKVYLCPFCLAEADVEHPIGIDAIQAVKTFECHECGAVWKNRYDFVDLDILRIPSRLTLCCERDKLIFSAIDQLEKNGDDHLSQRLRKLFTGGYQNANL